MHQQILAMGLTFAEEKRNVSFLRIRSHLLKKSLMENFIFRAVTTAREFIEVATLQKVNCCKGIFQ